MKFLNYLGLCLLLVTCSCASKHKIIENQNQSHIYNPGTSYLHPEYLIFHQADSVSQLVLRVNADELLFNQANPENTLQAKIKVQYQLIDITADPLNNAITDSATVVKKLEKTPGKSLTLQTYLIKAQYGKVYSLKVILSDILRGSKELSYVFVNKLNKYTGQNYKPISRLTDLPLFRNFIVPNEGVRIINNNQETKKLYIRYRKDDTPLPPPPFSVQTEPKYVLKEDSLWVLPYNPKQSFLFQYKGNYLIQTDSLQTESLSLINAGPSFPKVMEPDMMIPPLEYLTTTEEFNSLKKGDTTKLTVDNFWLKAGGNVEMARELIRIYYNRMYYSNLFFTSYKQGWRTDRGMIYLIFGPPSYITKTATSEIWEYYVKQDASNLTITFNKVASPYSENHYVMLRNDSYTRYWRNAVDSWRKGKAYSLEE